MRIVFLVNPESTSLEVVDQIIDYNRSLWGGRFNPIILTDGHTIDDKWWQFLRDIDPDVINPLVRLGDELIERFENFLSPLKIEQFREDEQSNPRTQVSVYNTPAGIDLNSLSFPDHWLWHGKPTLGIFNLDEMEDDIGKRFVLRNFGTYEPTNTRLHIGGTFRVPRSLESTLAQGEVPSEIHEGFKKAGIPFSTEVFSKPSLLHPGNWAIIDEENKQIQYVRRLDTGLSIQPQTRSFGDEFSDIDKKVCLVSDWRSLADSLVEITQNQNIVFRDQICALPNTERESEEDTRASCFEVIVGDELQDIVYFWNRPLAVGRFRRQFMNQIWLPKTLATDPDMEDALCTWIYRAADRSSGTPKTVRYVSFSTEQEELEDIASRFCENRRAHSLSIRTVATCFEEPQIPNFSPEVPLFLQREHSLFSRENSIDIHRAQGNKDIIELTEPKGLSQRGLAGHWMADFCIEFVHDEYENRDEVEMMTERTLFWRLPNRNYLARYLFDKPSRIRRNGFPSVMVQIGENVLRLTLANAELVVASLFCHDNTSAYGNAPRTPLTVRPYASAETSDKGKYLRGVLELFGNLAFAREVFSNPYWRSVFDALSKNINAEQHAHESIANKVTKWIRREGVLTGETSDAIKSLAAFIVDESKKLTLKQREFSFDKFMQVAKCFWKKEKEHISESDHASEMTMFDFGFGEEDVKRKLARLTQQNIVQIGVKPRCPNCGMVHWYHVDDIGQHVTCQGCRSQFPLHPELTWHYRLNSLIHAAHALHGITPAVLVLGQLLEESKTSFLFSSSLNLLTFTQDESSERWEKAAEVDIACIQDGEFIIGEVKQSRGLFKANDFDTMAEIAERVKPNKILFSCIDSQEPTPSIINHIERIRERLSPLEIKVTWYELEYLDYVVGV